MEDQAFLEWKLLLVYFEVFVEEGVPSVDGQIEELFFYAVFGQCHEVDLVEIYYF